MIFLNELNSSFKQRMFYFLIFSLICIEYATGNEGAGGSRGSSRIKGKNKHVQESTQATHGLFDELSPNVQKQYEIRIYTRLYDGGSVRILQEWENNVRDTVVNIEDLLNILNIASVEYIENGRVKLLKKSKYLPNVEKETIMEIKNLLEIIQGRKQHPPLDPAIFQPLFAGHVMTKFLPVHGN
uniref:Uncharacterized protein n=1 Tax=Meloidogyne floridensis TaxID=298350 RepID=A0A915NL67_9BILA